MSAAAQLQYHPGVIVQFVDAKTGAVRQRVPGMVCRNCGDIVLGGVGVDARGHCGPCVRDAKERA